ncbi:MAG: hypothetical protein ACK4Y7_01580 [Caldimicrobium sp.]
MKNLFTFLILSGLLIVNSSLYARGPQGMAGPKMGKDYPGAGIGKEVSPQVKEMREADQNTKGEIGEWVREKAQNKTRIQIHKESQKEIKENKTIETSKRELGETLRNREQIKERQRIHKE